ncbi:protein BTG4 [Polypterus senegalus]|nr:protein BTG4 [Polypterus senegalus]
MKEEIAATVFFFTRLAKKHDQLGRKDLERFAIQLTALLFEKYKGHWYPESPNRGQAYRCIRMNKQQIRDPLLERACLESRVDYEALGLPREITVWVDPREVCCRYGEKNRPMSVALLEGKDEDREISKRIAIAVEKATSDYYSGTSSDDEGSVGSSSTSSQEVNSIPTVSNPNSVYQFADLAVQSVPSWSHYKRKAYPETYHHQPAVNSCYLPYRTYKPSAAFSGPRVDRYHWVSKKRC